MTHSQSKKEQQSKQQTHDTQIPAPEVVPKAVRRRFSASYKLSIVEEASRCTKPGETGALLRREGLYSSHLTTWRRQYKQGQLDGLSSQKRGRKPEVAPASELAALQREKAQLEARLEQAELIIEVQKTSRSFLG